MKYGPDMIPNNWTRFYGFGSSSLFAIVLYDGFFFFFLIFIFYFFILFCFLKFKKLEFLSLTP